MKKLFFSMMGLVFALGLLACEADKMYSDTGNMAAATGDANIAVSTAALSAAEDITSMQYEVTPGAVDTNDDGFPVTGSLTLTGSVWGGTIANIPVGTARLFTVNAYGADGPDDGTEPDLLYTGSVTANVTAGTPVGVTVFLYQVTAEDPFTNQAPLITGLVISDGHIAPNEHATFTATATDFDNGEVPLSLTWDFEGGSAVESAEEYDAGLTTQIVDWSSEDAGTFGLTLTVTDSLGLETSVSVDPAIIVYALGSAEVTVDVTSDPVPLNLLVENPGYVSTTNPLDLTVTIQKPDDNEVVSYEWYAVEDDCTGIFTDGDTDVAAFTLTADDDTDGFCTLGVTVTFDDPDDTSSKTVSNYAEVILPIGPPTFTVTWTVDEPLP